MALSLKILINGDSKVMRLAQEMSVHEVLHEIREKTKVGGEDHGLYDPGLERGRTPGWLRENQSLAALGLINNMELHYKKKHGVIQTKLLDGTVKKMQVSFAIPISEVLQQIGEKMSLAGVEEYGLQLEGKSEWLPTGQNLSELRITEKDVLVLKKKFFFSDANVDRADPVGLHLLYVQSRDSIISGEHPTQRTEARDLAALQCQIVSGNYVADKHKDGLLDMQAYFPPTYRKDKHIEKDVFKEWRKLVGMSELNAKYRYIQLCRSLKTYGITTFEVIQETDKKKKRKILFGVTRESIVLLEPETKEIEKSWPLKTVRRWASNPSGDTLTLDFGDYEKGYIILKTSQAESISGLISGYVEIILKARKEAARHYEDDNTQIAYEENVHRPTFSAVSPYISNVRTMTVSGSNIYPTGTLRKKLDVFDFRSAINYVTNLVEDLNNTPDKPIQTALKPDQWRNQLEIELSNLQPIADQFLELTKNPSLITRNNLDEIAKKIAIHIDQVAGAAKNCALSGVKTNYPVLEGAKAMSECLKNMMTLCETIVVDNRTLPLFAEPLQLSQTLYATSQKFLHEALEGISSDANSKEFVESAGRAALTSLKLLEDIGHKYNATISDYQKQSSADHGLKVVINSAQILGSSVFTLSSALVIPECRSELNNVAKATTSGVASYISLAKSGGGSMKELESLLDAADEVNKALKQLVSSTACSEQSTKDIPNIEKAQAELHATVEELKRGINDRNIVVASTRAVANSAAQVVTAAKLLAKMADPQTAERLLSYAKDTADSMSALVAAAKVYPSRMGDANARSHVLNAADGIDEVSESLSNNANKINSISSVRQSTKKVIASSLDLMSAIKGNSVVMTADGVAIESTLNAASQAAASINTLTDMLRDAGKDASNDALQERLIILAQEAAVPTMDLVANARKILPKINDLNLKHDIKFAADTVAEELQKLMSACKAVRQEGDNMTEVIEQIGAVVADLETVDFAVQSGVLRAAPGQSKDDAVALLNLSAKQMATHADRLKTAHRSAPKQVAKSGKEVANILSQLGAAVKSVASTTPDKNTQRKVVVAAKDLVGAAENYIELAHQSSVNPDNKELQAKVIQAHQKFTSSVASLSASAKGLDTRECDEVIFTILQNLNTVIVLDSIPVGDFAKSSDELASSTKALGAAVTQATNTAKSNPKSLGPASKIVGSTVVTLVDSARKSATLAPEPALAEQILANTREILQKTADSLNYAISVAADPSNNDSLLHAAKELSNALTRMLSMIGSGSTNKACEEASDIILAAMNKLDDNASVRPRNLYEAIDDLSNLSKTLAALSANLVSSSRGTPEQLGNASKDVAEAITEIVEAARVAVNSTAGSGKQAPKEFIDISKIILSASAALIGSSSDPAKVLASARTIATATSNLFTVAKREATTMSDPNKQQILLNNAQNLAACTSGLARAAKAVQSSSPGAAELLAQAGSELEQATNAVLEAASSEGDGKEAVKLEPEQARKIIDSVRNLSTYTAQLIHSASEVSGKPKDADAQTALSAAAKAETDAIQELIKLCSSSQPGFAECEESVDIVQETIGDLDALLISAAVGNLTSSSSAEENLVSNQQSQEDLVNISKGVASSMVDIVNASRLTDYEALGKAAKNLASRLPNLVTVTQSVVSTSADADFNNNLLTLAKDLSDNILLLLQCAKSATINPSDDAHKEVANKSRQVTQSLGALVASLKSSVIVQKDFEESIKVVDSAQSSVRNNDPSTSDIKTYEDAKNEISTLCKELGTAMKKLGVNKSNVIQVGSSSKDIANVAQKLAEVVKVAVSCTNDESLKQQIIKDTDELLQSAKNVLLKAKDYVDDPKSPITNNKLSESFKNITGSVTKLLTSAKKGAIGELQCDEAVESIAKAVADLDAASIFAAAGQLDIDTNIVPSEVQKELLATSKQLAASSSSLVNASKTTQDQLGASAKALAGVVDKVASLGKSMGGVLTGDAAAQQNMLAQVKAVVLSAQQLVSVAKEAQRFKTDHNMQKALMKGVDNLAEGISSLINNVQTSNTEASSGVIALNTAKAQLEKQIQAVDEDSFAPIAASAEDIVKSARVLAAAAAHLASSNGKQEVIVKSSSEAVEACKLLLQNAKAAAQIAGDDDLTLAVINNAKKTAEKLMDLFTSLKEFGVSGIGYGSVSTNSTAIAESLAELVNSAKKLPGGGNLSLEEKGGNDLDELAASELNTAAKAIQAAAAALLSAKPPPKTGPKVVFDTADVNEAIYNSAIAITGAVGTLVKAAGQLQQETVAKQQSNPLIYKKDSIWANGLISASKSVAGACQQLVNTANLAVQGKAQEEELVAVARSVAAATAQLVSSSRVKSDPNSEVLKALTAAAKNVATSTSQLVEASKTVASYKEEEEEEEMASNYTGNAVKEIEARMRVLRLEKELEKARESMLKTRKNEYKR